MTEHGVRMIDGVELTPKEVGLDLPTPVSVDEERLLRKQKLAGALRIFGRLGFGEGVAGHITVRDPEFPDHFWVNPFGMSFRHIRVSDLILVNHDGAVVYGRHPVNRAAFVLHSAIHQARPDVISAAHAHSVHGKAWSSLGRLLDPITQDSCAFYEDHTVIADEGGAVVFEIAAGRTIAGQFGPHKAAIHQNHGLFTVGGRSTRPPSGSSRWSGRVRRSCSPRPPVPPSSSPMRPPPTPANRRRIPPQAGSVSSRCGRRSPALIPNLFD